MNIFDEWKGLTRSFFSMKIALDREAALWQAIEIKSPAHTELEVTRGARKYQVTLAEHMATIADEHPLCAMALNLSYSLTEAFARKQLGVDRLEGGIEGWGTLLLKAAGRDWKHVVDGIKGMIEVAVARSAVAHDLIIAQPTIDRFSGAGCACPWQVGDAIRLDFETTQLYRDRLRSLLRVCGPKKAPKSPSNKKNKKKRRKPRRTEAQEARRALRIAYRADVRASKTPQ
jgi:hypothetical protein